MKQILQSTILLLWKQRPPSYSSFTQLHPMLVIPSCCSFLTQQQHHHHQQQQQYFARNHHNRNASTITITTTSTQIKIALRRLSLSKGFSTKELRDAYFDAAKQCHPDSHSSSKDITIKNKPDEEEDETKAQLTDMFLEITDAYELLRQYPGGNLTQTQLTQLQQQEYDNMDIMPKSQRQYYREAVKEALGIDAEILEESKKCPMFREWLKGRSHMAFHFNLFLMRHGGLAPMLGGEKIGELAEGIGSENGVRSRRKRRKR